MWVVRNHTFGTDAGNAADLNCAGSNTCPGTDYARTRTADSDNSDHYLCL